MTLRSVWLGWSTAALAAATVTAWASGQTPARSGTTVVVYKSPTCQCCEKWIAHMRAAGFTVVSHDTEDHATVMTSFGVPFRVGSCHTASVGRYVVEGHVPADLIQRILKEHPAIAGLAVPGMVTGSPGMEGPGARGYDVVAWTRTGNTSVYAKR